MSLIDKFKAAWIGCFCLDAGLRLRWQFTPLPIGCFLGVIFEGIDPISIKWLLVIEKKEKYLSLAISYMWLDRWISHVFLIQLYCQLH